MANVTITELPSVVGLDGSELFETSQAGTSKKGHDAAIGNIRHHDGRVLDPSWQHGH
jgi:hypothetical protein